MKKIYGDERIYTNEVYENQEEELLLNFDHNGCRSQDLILQTL
ncbi:hypothetical protein [Rickettsia bellii]|uniref:Uncharacterized protein n=1 Tax=Rickettsia bellii str. RML Mogi TaxID=1359194 RepID=A0A0F3QI55_RICBE|nr:hypothetical protein [Rickettsia bellii]KJV91831.1 hypothetical protein RBEMOGI_0443 [Rickettsia bellii str. RML Mogi]